jgi:hypothetical protein
MQAESHLRGGQEEACQSTTNLQAEWPSLMRGDKTAGINRRQESQQSELHGSNPTVSLYDQDTISSSLMSMLSMVVSCQIQTPAEPCSLLSSFPLIDKNNG